MKREIIFLLLGAALGIIVLKIISGRNVIQGSTSKAAIDVLKTPQAINVMLTNEFRELAKTVQFRTLMKTLAANEINALSNAMTVKQF